MEAPVPPVSRQTPNWPDLPTQEDAARRRASLHSQRRERARDPIKSGSTKKAEA